MKTKQLAQILNVDVRRLARQKFKKELDVIGVVVNDLDGGDYHITVTFETSEVLRLDYDCHGHLISET